jgi:hypothetical protein
MAVVSLDSLSFSGLVWAFKLLPSKHIETSKWSQRAVKINENYIHMVKSLKQTSS